ncbi:hypothetical protein THASP1DRAFT_33074 [Thamnocephalis sphaerospora]|uniref:Uncharacterized protein n=1 Tax=Thamnocephalis sphaerospora TaxID=78915 RepID=A0A4P9XHE2_9FUNG|nr:hypothetical protein THASP1DRAFT_33074 [Thamnocephalis sphaerospora]|eukprot:RKP05094.1 hypothetical protein THASP1DRAFT_33074 [Thamnocephalis sphaerospora]
MLPDSAHEPEPRMTPAAVHADMPEHLRRSERPDQGGEADRGRYAALDLAQTNGIGMRTGDAEQDDDDVLLLVTAFTELCRTVRALRSGDSAAQPLQEKSRYLYVIRNSECGCTCLSVEQQAPGPSTEQQPQSEREVPVSTTSNSADLEHHQPALKERNDDGVPVDESEHDGDGVSDAENKLAGNDPRLEDQPAADVPELETGKPSSHVSICADYEDEDETPWTREVDHEQENQWLANVPSDDDNAWQVDKQDVQEVLLDSEPTHPTAATDAQSASAHSHSATSADDAIMQPVQETTNAAALLARTPGYHPSQPSTTKDASVDNPIMGALSSVHQGQQYTLSGSGWLDEDMAQMSATALSEAPNRQASQRASLDSSYYNATNLLALDTPITSPILATNSTWVHSAISDGQVETLCHTPLTHEDQMAATSILARELNLSQDDGSRLATTYAQSGSHMDMVPPAVSLLAKDFNPLHGISPMATASRPPVDGSAGTEFGLGIDMRASASATPNPSTSTSFRPYVDHTSSSVAGTGPAHVASSSCAADDCSFCMPPPTHSPPPPPLPHLARIVSPELRSAESANPLAHPHAAMTPPAPMLAHRDSVSSNMPFFAPYVKPVSPGIPASLGAADGIHHLLAGQSGSVSHLSSTQTSGSYNTALSDQATFNQQSQQHYQSPLRNADESFQTASHYVTSPALSAISSHQLPPSSEQLPQWGNVTPSVRPQTITSPGTPVASMASPVVRLPVASPAGTPTASTVTSPKPPVSQLQSPMSSPHLQNNSRQSPSKGAHAQSFIVKLPQLKPSTTSDASSAQRTKAVVDGQHAARVTAAFQRLQLSEREYQTPITPKILLAIRGTLDMNESDDRIFWGICLVGFFGLVPEELLPDREVELASGPRIPLWFNKKIVFFKKPVTFAGETTTLPYYLQCMGSHPLCPSQATHNWLVQGDARKQASNATFYLPGVHSPESGQWLRARLARALSEAHIEGDFTLAGLRLGGAVCAVEAGIPLDHIRRAGGWTGAPFMSPMQVGSFSKRFAAHVSECDM